MEHVARRSETPNGRRPTRHERPRQQESFASALALLIQIEDRCDTWFTKKEDRANAFRATTLVELQVLRDWHEHLSDPKQAKERQWCADRLAKLVKERLPEDDRKSRLILQTMLEDEQRHGENALQAGGADFPRPVKDAMSAVSQVMTKSSYWV